MIDKKVDPIGFKLSIYQGMQRSGKLFHEKVESFSDCGQWNVMSSPESIKNVQFD